jgi:hypothetical protein
MMESLEEAVEELKRADHLIYVSLKYTRTVDVLLNIITRMIEGYERMIDVLLEHAVEKKMVEILPTSPIERGNLVKRLFPDEKVMDNMELYFLLRKLSKSKVERENEFRRHLTMRTVIDGKEEIVNIDIITSYYDLQKEFLEHVQKIVDEEGKEDKEKKEKE